MTDQYVRAARPVPRSAARTGRVHRLPSVRRYAMTRPSFFAVDYAINPWMDVTTPVDAGRAQAQWEALRRTYLRLGHRVDVIEPVAGLPDMVYAANGGFIAETSRSWPGFGSRSGPASPAPTPNGCARWAIGRCSPATSTRGRAIC